MTSRAPVDVIVVGSGAAGGWAAKELTEQGLSVTLLEAGPAVQPDVDFPLPAPPHQRLLSRLTHGVTRQPIQMRCPAFDARTRRFFVDDRDNPYTTPAGSTFNWFRGRQVGGRLHTWARVVMRLTDREFARGWPIGVADLASAYDKVESFLGVAESTLTPPERSLKNAVEAAFPDRQVVPVRLAAHEVDRIPATLRAAQATGRLDLRSNRVVRHITVDPATGAATGVTCIDRVNKTSEDIRASAVVLCASTIESVRILLNSSCAAHPHGLGNSSGVLGRGLMDHVLVGLGGPSPAAAANGMQRHDPYDFAATTGFRVPRFQNVGGARAGFEGGYMVQGGLGRGPSWYLLAHGEMLPRPDNGVSVNPAVRDAWGIPAAHITCTWSSNERAMIEDAKRAMNEIVDAAGLTVRIPPSGKWSETLAFRIAKRQLQAPEGAFLPGSAIHELGGAAMGTDASTSVVNAFGQCWDAPNVFVADGACFPSGCSQNVTLTIMALAVRACGHLVSEHRRGRL